MFSQRISYDDYACTKKMTKRNHSFLSKKTIANWLQITLKKKIKISFPQKKKKIHIQ